MLVKFLGVCSVYLMKLKKRSAIFTQIVNWFSEFPIDGLTTRIKSRKMVWF